MPEGLSVINLGKLSKPATVLIEKIAEATGGVFRPFQIRRVAQAEADAEIIKASTKIKIADLKRRALHRFINEEAKKQANIESITQKALPAIEEKAQPEKIEGDWITNFFDKCRLISDEQMQNLWSTVLAGEANSSGSYSKRTVNLLASFDKRDAEWFAILCSFVWYLKDKPHPMIYDLKDEIYINAGLGFSRMKHLETIGLISIEPSDAMDFGQVNQPSNIVVNYHGTRMNIKFRREKNNKFITGQVIFSKAGEELAQICSSPPRDGFVDYILKKWKKFGYKVSEITSLTP